MPLMPPSCRLTREQVRLGCGWGVITLPSGTPLPALAPSLPPPLPNAAPEVTRLAEAALPFIERVATQRAGGAQARARTLALCGSGATVAYSMIGPGSQYCENVGRPHASNHVYFVADFCRGVYAQKCHDPDCARFRSGWMPLPPNLCLPGAGAGPSPQGSSRRSGSSAGRQQGARASSRGGAL